MRKKSKIGVWKIVARCGFSFTLLSSSFAFAAELPDPFLSIRSAGQGHSYTAVVDNTEALILNPAALAKVSGYHWTIFGVSAGLDGADVATTAANAGASFADTVNSLYGKVLWGGGSFLSALSLGSFAVGIYGNLSGGTDLHNPAYPVMNVNFLLDYAFVAGLGFELVPGVWTVGASVRRILRTGASAPLGPSTLAALNTATINSQLQNQGTGFGADIGMMFTIPAPVRPTLSLLYRNAGGTSFAKTSGASAPPAIPQNMIVGGAIQISAPFLTVTPSFDYHYADRYDIENSKKVHFGLELGLPLFDVRGGINQGYWTLGGGINLGVLRFDAASYGVELGEYAGQQEDRRYVVQMTLELGFDPNKFFGKDKSGKSRNERYRSLKQRR